VDASDANITLLLERWRSGQQEALAELMPLVYQRLHHLAAGLMRSERVGHTLSPTAVVHEAYVRLNGADIAWQDRGHFLAIASREMRRVLVDHARARKREKRGGDLQRVSLSGAEEADAMELDLAGMLAIESALDKLNELDPRKTQVVDLILFGGLSIPETAEALGLSMATVNRDWKFARGFLQHELKSNSSE